MQPIHTFPSAAEAIEYRQRTGCGGWIFAGKDIGVIFPFGMTLTEIFNHPVIARKSGEFLC
jgi:hypothetical protein